MPTFRESVGSFLLEVTKVVIISLAIIIPIRYFLIQPFYVKGASMEPNFYDNEYLVVDEISYRFHNPKRGDVVVIRNPRHESDFLIKRVVALPGERIEIMNGYVTINNTAAPSGMTLTEPYLDQSVRTTGTVNNLTLASNEYYVLGDNRESSLDSRYFGPVVRRDIIGRTWIRAWPVSRIRAFSTPAYTTTAP
jgi:signal peptidase I